MQPILYPRRASARLLLFSIVGKGWVADGQGIPLGFHLESAQVAEVTLAEPTLDTVRVPNPAGQPGRPRTCPCQLVADRGYNSGPFRRALRRRGIRACIPPKRRPKTWRPKRGRPVAPPGPAYRHRWKIERSFAWLGNYRRLLIRWQHDVTVYQGFFTFVLMLVCINHLLK